MIRSFARPFLPLFVVAVAFSTSGCNGQFTTNDIVQLDRVIAGGPDDSLEVRHLVLRGTNEQIRRALAELAKERYGARPEPAQNPLQVRAKHKFLQQNYPILLDRMRGVAAAFGKSCEDDAWDFSTIGFTDLRAGCSIAHLPPSCMANGQSVVSRDYDFTTGALNFDSLPSAMLHPTARPYLLELHPDKGYASIAMVAYDLLSGVLDGINSEGLTVTIAMDAELMKMDGMEPTRKPAVGLGELQTARLLLDTCANVDEAKQVLWATKQYYQYVPIHYLIADRHGNAFVWEYSKAHNQEFVIESPGEPLIMTNFTLNQYLDGDNPPSAEKARDVCKRYAHLREKLSQGSLDDATIRGFHKQCDAQASPEANPSEPPERTFWHAFYYPEDRKVRLSYYLRDEPNPDDSRYVRTIRTDYLEFRLEPTHSDSSNTNDDATSSTPAPATTAAAPAPPIDAAPTAIQLAIETAGGSVKRDGARIVGVSLDKAAKLDAIRPLLSQLQHLEELSLVSPNTTEADIRALQGLPNLQSLSLMGAPIGDDSLEVLTTLPALRILNLIETKITDNGLAHLSKLNQLEYLGLKDTAVSDVGLVHLKNLQRLETLNLADTNVSDAGLVHLAGLTRLEGLNLSNTNVTDAGLADVARIPSLGGLNLGGTKVTDAGLVQLKPIAKLTKLDLTGTAVTDEGVMEAKKFLPFWMKVTR